MTKLQIHTITFIITAIKFWLMVFSPENVCSQVAEFHHWLLQYIKICMFLSINILMKMLNLKGNYKIVNDMGRWFVWYEYTKQLILHSDKCVNNSGDYIKNSGLIIVVVFKLTFTLLIWHMCVMCPTKVVNKWSYVYSVTVQHFIFKM